MDRYAMIQGLEPQAVLRCFWEFSQVPRIPGEMEPASDFLASFIRRLGLEVRQDAHHNVIARKPASKGYEQAPMVMLQAHMDMVCEKEPRVEHDFRKEPIRILVEDGDKITADGTTLGADDGLGVAMIMAILEDASLEHPALEAVFTADEETDMNGAAGLDFSRLKSKIIINLDSAAIRVCGAGEMGVRIMVKREEEPVKEGSLTCSIRIGGLLGGHSGAQAMEERGNAAALLGRVLCGIEKETCIRLCSVQGGRGFSTSIARDAEAVISFEAKDQLKIVEIVQQYGQIFKQELEKRDPGVTATVSVCDQPAACAFTRKMTDTILTLLTCLPDGVASRNREFEGAMESCSNVGILETYADRVEVGITIRSTAASKKYQLYEKVYRLCRCLRLEPKVISDLPQWDYHLEEGLRELIQEIYPDCPLSLSQGTLEAGIFCQNMPGVSYVALAPPYYNAHSPNEYFLASECKKSYERLLTVLSRIGPDRLS